MAEIENFLCMGCMSRLDENGKCRCGFDENSPCDETDLPLRTKISERYIIGRELHRDGEGIVYIGFDTENEERVFVKEYFPMAVAKRNVITNCIVPTAEYEVQYKMMLSDYADLFSSISKTAHQEYIIPVSDIVYENGTCYIVFKYIKTISYGDYLSHNGGEFTWPQVKKLFMPLLAQLSHLHADGFVHRGISPETIRVNSKGKLLLAYFGTSSLYIKGSVIEPTLSEGYAAPEQYSGSNWQGAWTDVYGVAAVMYKSLTGTLPMPSDDRMVKDEIAAPDSLEQNIPSNVSDAIMNAMTLDAEYRLRSIDEFTAELLESTGSNTRMFVPKDLEEEKKVTEEEPVKKKRNTKKKKKRILSENGLQFRIPWGLVACVIFFIVLLLLVRGLMNSSLMGFNKKDSETTEILSGTDEENEEDGNYLVTVPNFVGRLKSNVEGNSLYSQFTLRYEEETSQSYSEGMIFEQSVSYRSQVAEGTEIILKVSTGPEKTPMPQLVGKTLTEAVAELSELGIAYQAVPNYSTDYEYMVVFEQSVDAGDDVVVENNMSKVTIYYGATDSSSRGGITFGNDDDDHDGVIVLGG